VDERFLGDIVYINPDNDIISIKPLFLTEEKKKTLYEIWNSKKSFSFAFRKPYKESKTTKQLRTYFMLLNQILDKLDIPRDKDIIDEFDRQILTTLYPCRFIGVLGQQIPVPPSKSEMSKEDMSILIQNILEAYKELDLKIEEF
jgi:hypothetical protein